MSDRTVHARNADLELVRYDRSGKWYLEPKGRLGDFTGCPPRRHIKIGEAVDWALTEASYVYLNQPGGVAFDRMVRRG